MIAALINAVDEWLIAMLGLSRDALCQEAVISFLQMSRRLFECRCGAMTLSTVSARRWA